MMRAHHLRSGLKTLGGLCAAAKLLVRLLALVLSLGSAARAEVALWQINDGERNWQSVAEASTAIDFDGPNAIQIAGFRPGENIVSTLSWVDGIPRDGFDLIRSKARIWNNYPLKKSDLPIVDGDPNTSTEDRFKVFGSSQAGKRFFLDLGSRFPLNRIVFYPRLTGIDTNGKPLWSDYIRGYELYVNDGLSFGTDGQPIYGDPIKKVEFSRDSVSVVEFELDFVRYIMLRITATNPFEIAEIELYGEGFVPRGEYRSEVIDLGAIVNFGTLNFSTTKVRVGRDSVVEEAAAMASATIQMRSGLDDTPLIFYEVTNRYLDEQTPVTEEEYNALSKDDRAGFEDDQINWSRWSAPFTESGHQVGLPSPRRYVQFRVVMESRSILDGIRIDDLGLEIASPLARGLVGEISLLGDPDPSSGFAVVPVGVFSPFVYDVRAAVADGDMGFDALRISTPTKPQFTELFIGPSEDALTAVVPDSVREEADALTLFFPGHRVDSTTSLRVVFNAQLLVQSTFFNGEVFDTESEELPQPVLPDNASQQVTTDKLQVLTSAESRSTILPFLEAHPSVVSPNGDGINDEVEIRYAVLQILEELPNRIEIFSLAGQRVYSVGAVRGRGVYSERWDGRDHAGQIVPVGIYLLRVAVEGNVQDFAHTHAIAVVY